MIDFLNIKNVIMRSRLVKNLAKACLVLLVVSVLSSCNRGGYGCPNNFKVVPSFALPFSK